MLAIKGGYDSACICDLGRSNVAYVMMSDRGC